MHSEELLHCLHPTVDAQYRRHTAPSTHSASRTPRLPLGYAWFIARGASQRSRLLGAAQRLDRGRYLGMKESTVISSRARRICGASLSGEGGDVKEGSTCKAARGLVNPPTNPRHALLREGCAPYAVRRGASDDDTGCLWASFHGEAPRRRRARLLTAR